MFVINQAALLHAGRSRSLCLKLSSLCFDSLCQRLVYERRFKAQSWQNIHLFVMGAIKYEVFLYFVLLLSMILVFKVCIISVLVLLASTDYQGSSLYEYL